MENLPRKISRYKIVEKLEEGNYAKVYRAKDNEHDVILKVARDNMPEFNQLILREFQILSQFTHPNIVTVYEYDVAEDGSSFFTMEYIKGKPITDFFYEFTPELVAAIIQVINALSAFHNAGFVHSDLKPEHIIYNPEEKKAVIIDFGFAGVTTHEKKVSGTIGYIAPEILKGIGFDQRSDLYSLGVILYKILAHKKPSLPLKPIVNVPEDVNNTIIQLIAEEPNLRPTAPEVYDFFSKFLPEKEREVPRYQVLPPLTGFVEIPEVMQNLYNLKGGTIMVVGESGLGKTRLLNELKYHFLSKEYNVLFFKGSEEKYLHNAIYEFINFVGSDASEKEDSLQMYAEITERLLEFSRGKNVIILVDDLDNLNDYEFGLFRYIGHSVKDSSISLIGTTKPAPTIKDLKFLEINLRPFTIEEVKSLIEKTFFKIEFEDEDGKFYFIEWLYKFSGGNSLFITEAIDILYQQKILVYKENRWVVDVKLLKEVKISKRMEEIISARLKTLNQEELNLLKVLCIADYPLSPSILSIIIPDKANLYLETLKFSGLIKEERLGRINSFSLSNQIVKFLLEKEMNEDEIKEIVKKIVKAIEELEEDESLFPLQTRLYGEIKDLEKTYRYSLLSARIAEKNNNFKDAILYYEKALINCANIEPENYPEINLKLGDLYFKTGDNQKAIAYYKKAREFPNIKLNALSGLGNVHMDTGDFQSAIEQFQEVLDMINDIESREYFDNAHHLAYCLISLENFDEGERILKKSLNICERIKDYTHQADALYYLSTLEWFRGDYKKAEEICLELINLCREYSLEKEYAYAANLLGSISRQIGEFKQGLKYTEIAIDKFRKMKSINALAAALDNRASILLETGDSENALKVFDESLRIYLRIGKRSGQYISITHIASIYEQFGRFDKALEYYNWALQLAPDSVYVIYGLSTVYYKIAQFDKAKSILEEGLKKFKEPVYLIHYGIIDCALKRFHEARGKIEEGIAAMAEMNMVSSLKYECYIRASQFYYEMEEFEKALNLAEMAQKTTIKGTREFIIADSFININQFRLGWIENLNIEDNLMFLKSRGYLYDYAYLKKLVIESIIDKGVEYEQIKKIAEELELIEQVFKSIGASFELSRAQKLLLDFYPVIVKDYSRRVISADYINTFSRLADLINSHLGDEDFISNVLDIVIDTTGAERGAIFIKSEKEMEFVAGRNMDRKTINDASVLSKTAIAEVNKNRIVFVPDAISDPRFNIKKSVLLNQIRTILCIPMVAGQRVLGAIYLDSRLIGSIFREEERDFLISVSNILASVIDKSRLFSKMREELSILKDGIVLEIGKGYIMGKSTPIKRVYKLINAVSSAESPVLLTGETGVGKGMLARLIHMKSRRKDNKFVSINCGTIPETLLESELFGYRRGAFTGAVGDKKGLLEEANGGTVFLDEITNTSPAFQAKMLEAIEDKVIRRLGETQTRTIDVRFIFATNKDLEIEVEDGRFRKDLYYRINVFAIKIPSLRERAEDIPVLAQFFLELKSKEMNKQIDGFSQDALALLKNYPWPGNVRELQNVIERAVVLARSKVITANDIGLRNQREILPLKELTKEAIINALNMTNFNIKESARSLGVSRRTIERYMKRFNITRPIQ